MFSKKIAQFPNRKTCKLSIVVACYNEELVLEEFHSRLTNTLESFSFDCEILYINDGSDDKTLSILSELSNTPNVYCINLSRNFGKEAAMKAGIDSATGSAIIFIDADLQDPPELIKEMVSAWMSGYEIVNMQRSNRTCDSRFKRLSASLYYTLMNKLSEGTYFPPNVSDYRLLGSRPLAALRSMPEKTVVLKNMINWLGFKSIEIPYEREHRFAGETKWGYFKLIKLALEGIFSFSVKPLRYFTLFSALSLLATTIYLIFSIVLGTVNIVDFLLLASACIAVGISILGEYIGIILSESKNRPHYFVSSNNISNYCNHSNSIKKITDYDEKS